MFDFDGTITTGALGVGALDSSKLFGGYVRIAKLGMVLRLLQEQGAQLYIVSSLGLRATISQWLSDVGLHTFFEKRIYGCEDVGSKPKYQLIRDRIMTPSSMAHDQVLFVVKPQLTAAAPFCQTYHVKSPTGLSDAEAIRICDAAGIKDAMLHVAAEHAKQLYFLKPYEKDPPSGASDQLKRDWEMDLNAVHLVERPNHALANGLRKALLVSQVADAYETHYNSGKFDKKAFEFGPKLELAMQVVILFEKCCRESDIGFTSDGKDCFLQYDQNSRAALSAFVLQACFDDEEKNAFDACLKSLTLMYREHTSAIAHVFEMAHGLDCLRCYDDKQMTKYYTPLAEHLGAAHRQRLATTAESMLRATGNRVLSSPSKQGQADYQKELFFKANTDVVECIRACRSVLPDKEELAG